MELQRPVFAKAEIVTTLTVQPSPASLMRDASHFRGTNSLWGGIATTVLAKCGSSITPLSSPGAFLPPPSVSPSCSHAAYCYSGHSCAGKKQPENFFGGGFYPDGAAKTRRAPQAVRDQSGPRYLRERRREESVLDLFSP